MTVLAYIVFAGFMLIVGCLAVEPFLRGEVKKINEQED